MLTLCAFTTVVVALLIAAQHYGPRVVRLLPDVFKFGHLPRIDTDRLERGFE